MVKKAFIVVGLGYGDEGKGLVTDYLCSLQQNSIVIRFNGGQQAGHCVVTKEGEKHIFSNFGSGSFRYIPTYWSNFCTFSPTFFLEELDLFGKPVKMFIDRKCLVTTPYDILYNRTLELTLGNRRKGSCGLGVGATYDRNEIEELKLHFEDLLDVELLTARLNSISDYYRYKINVETGFDYNSFDHITELNRFKDDILRIEKLIEDKNITVCSKQDVISPSSIWDSFIFEGAQGILLDKKFGHYPHITKSNTTSANAISLLCNVPSKIEIFYVTRAYQTRHGAGPFRSHDISFVLQNSNETNLSNDYQGDFKYSYLDIDALNYALTCDEGHSKNITKNLVITCLDQIAEENFKVYRNDLLVKSDYRHISNELKIPFKQVLYSFNSCADYIVTR